MKFGGIDPSIIRELSGVYKPFAKAFKELVCNSYDADATGVRIRVSDGFDSIEIWDDGRGMSLEEFHNEFAKIGGSYTRKKSEFTALGRPKIGSKGIGFLAVARYCSKMDIYSKSDSSRNAFHATLDFDYLLSLENRKDLGEIDDFYTLKYHRKSEAKAFTRIVISGIKQHVIDDLAMPKRSGNVKNISSMSGIERFIWHISRSSPLNAEAPEILERKFFGGLRRYKNFKYIDQVLFKKASDRRYQRLRYPVYGSHFDFSKPDGDFFIPVVIKRKGLFAKGYILAQPKAIHPAEYRGISIRVRNASVGNPTFFGAEKILTGARKAALSQITGELFVLKGFDAIDAINPGREGFYEENRDLRTLKYEFLGQSDSVVGLVGKAINVVLKRSLIENSLKDLILKVSKRRIGLLEIASSVNHYAFNGSGISSNLIHFLNNGQIAENGLSCQNNINIYPSSAIHGFEVSSRKNLTEDFRIDWKRRRIIFNFDQEKWSWKIYCYGRYYTIAPKDGGPEHPICEIDNLSNHIYINWNHPVKQHLDEVSFIKSAICWKIAFHASENDINNMMEIGLRLLSHKAY